MMRQDLYGMCTLILLILVANAASIEILTSTQNGVTKVMYRLDLSTLQMSDSYHSVFDNETNTTHIENITHQIGYDCLLVLNNTNSSNTSFHYSYNGTTSNASGIVDVAQQLGPEVDDGRYDAFVSCIYNVTEYNHTMIITLSLNESNMTYENITYDALHIANYMINDSASKDIVVDTIAPNITINYPRNITINATNNMILINITTSDMSALSCMINGMANTTFNVSAGTHDTLIPYSSPLGASSLTISCNDELNNSANTTSYYTLNIIPPAQEPFFSLTLDKASYNIGEIGYYLINATDGSNVSITICPISSGWVQCYLTPSYVNESYPKIQAMPYSNKTGSYIIDGTMRYRNYTLRANATFTVVNSMSASITASATTSAVGRIITFNATAQGGIGAYTYSWLLPDGTRMSGAGAYKNFTQPGTYTINLSINDSQKNNYNTSIDVVIKPYYQLVVIVTDNKTAGRLKDVTVEVGDMNATTDANGQAIMTLLQSSYELSLSKENYRLVKDDVTLNQNKTLYFNMSFVDGLAPQITLTTQDESSFAKGAVKLKFKAHDITTLSCGLYLTAANDSWYILKDSGDNLAPDTEYTFDVNDTGVGAYKWKIECSDQDHNKAISDEYNFIVSQGDIASSIATNDQLTSDTNRALDHIEGLSGPEAEVADLLGVKEQLKDILERNNNLDRDIHNLAYRRDLDEKGKEDAQKNLTDTIATLKLNTPVDIKVSASKTFIKYVKDNDLKMLLEDYQRIKGLGINPNMFLSSTKATQSRTVISTKVRNVVLYYADGRSSEITLVTRDIAIPRSEDQALVTSSTVSIVELIPKSIVPNAAQINMITRDYKVIKSDPLIEFPASTEKIVYYINRSISPDDFENADTVIIDKNVKAAVDATGFAVFGSSISDISFDGKTIMILIAVVLVIVYLVITFDVIDKIKALTAGTKKKVSYVRVLVNDALDNLSVGEYDKAALIYREIKLNYESASEPVQKQVFEECYELCNKLDAYYFKELSEEAESHARSSNYSKAIQVYDKLERTYSKIDDKYRKDLVGDLERIYKLIEEIRR